MKMKTRFTVAALVLVLGALPSSAYERLSGGIAWPASTLFMHAAWDQFTMASGYRPALQDAADAWNLNPSAFQFLVGYDTLAASCAIGNGADEIWFAALGAPATTYYWYNAALELTEADIVFDDGMTWATSNVKPDTYAYGGERSIQTVALHELGHALGLAHEADEYNIMGQDWDHIHANGTRVGFYAGEDASDGAVAIYGLDADVREDVSVAHWMYSGYSGEYSTHKRTPILDTAGDELPYTTDASGEPYYEVYPGDTVQIVVTVENNGANTQWPKMKFYHSTNNRITTLDTELDTRTPGVWRNNVYTITNTVVIPAGVAKGISYLGAIVDVDNAITEVREQNNSTYIGIEVK